MSTDVRKRNLIIGAASICALGAAVFTVHIGANRLSDAREAWLAANQSNLQADAVIARANIRGHLESAADTLLAKGAAMHLDPQQWVEQKINMNQTALSRDQANALLGETALNARQIFDAEDFDISVTGADDGLFDPPGNSATPDLRLTLRGTVLTRIGETP